MDENHCKEAGVRPALERLTLAGLWAGVAACAALSLLWRCVHDAPILVYMATLMRDEGAVPYRDFFDMNLPGTYAFFRSVIAVAGTSDVGLRVADLAWAAVGLGALYWGLRRWSSRVAGLGTGLAALAFLGGTWAYSLQREMIALAPLSVLFGWSLRAERVRWPWGVGAGLLVACVALVKPQLALLGAPPLLLLAASVGGRRGRLLFLAAAAAGFVTLVAATAAWLVSQGAWERFVEVLRYWTLYGEMDGDHVVKPALARVQGTVRQSLRMLVSPYTAAAALALATASRAGTLKGRELAAWLAMIALALLAPGLSGQFWRYHRLPFYVLTLSACGFYFGGQAGAVRTAARAAGLALAAVWLAAALPACYAEAFGAGAVETEKGGAPDLFARFLKAHAGPADRVQPLGWTGGAVHGMLLAGARPATRFLYTFHFYHHVDHPLIRSIREEFLSSLQARPPRFLLESVGDRAPSGVGTALRFEAFDRWRDGGYHVAESGERYRIWEINERE